MSDLKHKMLPPAAIAALQRAAQTPNTAHDPNARLKAIEAATERIKREFSDYFKE
ncbi:hypothetical protein [Cupriavidus metallidurans]|uniref:hypothetical protein n=1 Tax=Cupriavidus metallidurans TaxID=119219 RepID=UPI00164F0952|nr:hypothetical protein [Cupriavidus metallidurans]